MPLPLHIFEERYKAMIADCVRDRRPFGVVLIAEGAAEGDAPATPHAVGCTAEITQVKPLDDGRMLIISVGRERFRIVRLRHDRPYLVGVVQPAPLLAEDEAQLADSATHLEPLVMAYLDRLARLGRVDTPPAATPDDPAALAYLGAALIQLPAEQKQVLLAMDRVTELSAALRHVYRGELALMQTIPPDDIGPFSVN
jgi:Lon protease-like protein